ncbi:hypothetical protein [Vreelandella utahensis]|uniref:hypothetical protein n=1 Tax=Vreelandella halophila TaxID=86177 RepID=UPI000985A020|nr:hypothetical protein [Halomonas utahensis]
MKNAPQHWVSLDSMMQESDEGRLFVDPGNATVRDMSDVRILSFRPDTVRQLYRGKLKADVLDLFHEPGLVTFMGKRWHAGRISRDSGYQYKLQNADLGILLLIKSFHANKETEGNHLKIELSPQFLHSYSEQEVQQRIDELAQGVLENWCHGGCAVHIAADVQGWEPPSDFEARLHCRSKKVRTYNGLDEWDIDSHAVRYGRGESFLFGAPNQTQLAVYNKTDEARAGDKLDYWRNVWNQSGEYDPEEAVYRIEIRYHHNVVNQFARATVDHETGELFDLTSYEGLYPHLTGLWGYGFRSFRYLARPGWFDPFWTILTRLRMPEHSDTVEYRRGYKSADGFSGKNIELLLGNFVSCCARWNLSKNKSWQALQDMPFFDMIREHYANKGKGERELRNHMRKLLEERWVRYGRAV